MKISIIIPVFNVEPYLRQCLDSVVGQTLQELQILCVDHSSMDGSLAILKEFAAKDSRIEIIHCKNTGGGPGQARNAGLAYVKGKYVQFVDSDDWLDPVLCEKAYYRLEESSSDIMFLYPHEISEPGQEDRRYFGNVDKWFIESNASHYLGFPVPPWDRVLRTSYLESIAVRFPEGKLSEDNFFHWATLVHEPKVIFLPQQLYYHRLRGGSEMGERGEYASNQSVAYDMIKQYLLSIKKYEKYRNTLLNLKFCVAFWSYNFVLPEYRDNVKQSLLATIDGDEITFIKEKKISCKKTSNFCLDLLDMVPLSPNPESLTSVVQKVKKLKRKTMWGVKNFLKATSRKFMRPVENLVRVLYGKSKKSAIHIRNAQALPTTSVSSPVQHESNANRQIRELSELVCQLSKEVVELRKELYRTRLQPDHFYEIEDIRESAGDSPSRSQKTDQFIPVRGINNQAKNNTSQKEQRKNIQPKVTIILPVYNVKPYLRQCLDSIVNQTMQEIQIICVNDGSTDGSRAILQEYADYDTRIEIIDQENQGAGTARNAAYTHIRGKYTYFTDPDDWLELDLCQQCWNKAEETEADFVVLRHAIDECGWSHLPFNPSLSEIRRTPEEKHEILIMLSTWLRFWRSEFLLSNNINFSEGKLPYEDMVVAWKGTVLADRIAILDKSLYHYRIRPESAQQAFNKTHFVITKVYDDIGDMLQETGCYEIYKYPLLDQKLWFFWHVHDRKLPNSLQAEFIYHISMQWKKEEFDYCRKNLLVHLDKNVRDFYLSQGFGGRLGMQRYHSDLLSEIARLQLEMLRVQHNNNILKMSIKGSKGLVQLVIVRHLKIAGRFLERSVRKVIIKPIKVWFIARSNEKIVVSNNTEIISLSTQGSDDSPKRRAA